MLVTLTEVVSTNSNQAGSSMATKVFTLREITINPQHVICLREDSVMANRLDEGTLPQGLDNRQRFTKVTLDRGQSGLEPNDSPRSLSTEVSQAWSLLS
jgi:hypothetical protein